MKNANKNKPFFTNYPAGYKNKGRKPRNIKKYKNLGRIYNTPNGIRIVKPLKLTSKPFFMSNYPCGVINKNLDLQPMYFTNYSDIPSRYRNIEWYWMIKNSNRKLENFRTKNTNPNRISRRYAAAVAGAKSGTR